MPDTKQTASARASGAGLRRSIGTGASTALSYIPDAIPALGTAWRAIEPYVSTQSGREATRGFVEGLFTGSASGPAPTPAAIASTASGTAPPGKTKTPPPPPKQDDTPLTAMDWAQARAAKMLSNPKATVAQLQAAMGMVPAPVKSTGKDRVFDTFRQANDAMFAHQIQLIAPLQQSDPAKYAAEFDKAQQAYIGNHLKSLGVDPLANTLAEMQTQAEKD